jgi:hypothetical protein
VVGQHDDVLQARALHRRARLGGGEAALQGCAEAIELVVDEHAEGVVGLGLQRHRGRQPGRPRAGTQRAVGRHDGDVQHGGERIAERVQDGLGRRTVSRRSAATARSTQRCQRCSGSQ